MYASFNKKLQKINKKEEIIIMTEQKIEELALDILEFITQEHIWEHTVIYYNDRKMFVDDFDSPIVEENKRMYIKKENGVTTISKNNAPNYILIINVGTALFNELRDGAEEKLKKIFDKHGAKYETYGSYRIIAKIK